MKLGHSKPDLANTHSKVRTLDLSSVPQDFLNCIIVRVVASANTVDELPVGKLAKVKSGHCSYRYICRFPSSQALLVFYIHDSAR